ncbi:MAG: hypothetical protein J7L44_03290, partial [Candidatus Diapherotrites archaeon]|nr:hypothetical protein [Candidatus Diapherotrites archaeon]
MKKLFIPFVLFSIIIFASDIFAIVDCTKGINATELARWGAGGTAPKGVLIQIADTFRIPRLRAYNLWERLCVGAEVDVSDPDTGFNISFVRNEQKLDYTPSYLMLADRIEFEPPSGEEAPEPEEEEKEKEKIKEKIRKNEWIQQGASSDSPAITMVSEDFIAELCGKGQEKYPYGNYRAGKPCNVTYPLPKPSVFTTKRESISEIPSYYKAENGFTAYVIPFGGLKTEAFGGVQLFQTSADPSSALECKIFCTGTIGSGGRTITIHKATDNNRTYWYVDVEEAA